jgi:ABC-type multidrug transport system fused ATPase/permease subunit
MSPKVIYELQFLFQIPFLIVQLIQAQVSLTRLNGFLNAEEIDKKAIGHKTKDESNAIESDDASFTWDISQHIPTISNVNLNIKKSSTVAVVGQVFFFLINIRVLMYILILKLNHYF